MDPALVSQVRQFNRTMTQRVGALEDRYLARARPLGEARLLWEIGPTGREVRELRSELGFDSGYLSRLLRALESAGLITVGADAADGRVRVARLTKLGRAERKLLDQRSDELVEQLLDPLTQQQRDRLVTAMTEVERLIRASAIRIEEVDPAHRDAQFCLRSYFAELDARFENGFDLAHSAPAVDETLRRPSGLLLVAYSGSEPVGCGALLMHPKRIGELKRIWVAPAARGLGLGRRLLSELESRARENGARRVQLDTNRVLAEAITMYRSAGYYEIERFNDNPYAHHWFEKPLN